MDDVTTKTMPVQPLALGLRDAGKAMSLSERTVWGLIKEGRLRSVRIGVKHLVAVDEIRAFLTREAGQAPADATKKSENPVDNGAAST